MALGRFFGVGLLAVTLAPLARPASAEMGAPSGSTDAASGAASSAPAPPKVSSPPAPRPDPSASAIRQESLIVRMARPSPGAKTSDAVILPSGHLELGGEMVFIVGQAPMPIPSFSFTDVGLFRAHARRTFGDRLELGLATQLLAKQPSTIDAPIWQGSGAVGRLLFAKGYAVALAGDLGPLFGESGLYWRGGPFVEAKIPVDYFVRFNLAVGDRQTELYFEQRPVASPFWLNEILLHGEAQVGEERGTFWVALDYHVPVASAPGAASPQADPRTYIDPRIQLDFQIGGVMSFNNWDLYAIVSVIDQGDRDAPATMLPILDGGFDQTQIIFGVAHRFAAPRRRRAAAFGGD